MVTETYRASLDRRTTRVVLPVPNGDVEFSIKGTWGDPEDDPTATAVELQCRSRSGPTGKHGSYRLTHDAVFQLPQKTLEVTIQILSSTEDTDLEVRLTPVVTQQTPPKEARKVPLPSTWAADYAAAAQAR